MANTVVTSTANSIKVVFNDDSTKVGGITKGAFNKADIKYFYLHTDHVEVVAGDASRWIIAYEANSIGALIVDTVNGAGPTDLGDLYDKLVALIA